ncbi:MAG: hypothetical protein NDI77_08415 [Geobacteraceae bacterium]|nr:hypothetical protein [Geobacteraceae bacterium]
MTKSRLCRCNAGAGGFFILVMGKIPVANPADLVPVGQSSGFVTVGQSAGFANG